MRYFVSYNDVFHSDDLTKRESLRLETYTLLMRFLTRKQIPGNPIILEFNRFKEYFESHDFTSVYFLSPFILNENKLSKDIMDLIIHSGESNEFDKIFNEIKDEVYEIKNGRKNCNIEKINVKTADEFIERYKKEPEILPFLNLENAKERSILEEALKIRLAEGDESCSLLYLSFKRINVKSGEEVNDLILTGEKLVEKFPSNPAFDNELAELYMHPFYKGKDAYSKCFFYYSKGAEKNDKTSLYRLGVCYFLGRGCRKDSDFALELFKKSAALGSLDAVGYIGIYYLSKGRKEEAKEYLLKSAAKGDYKSLLLLDTDFARI